jgi:hypothetical protein
MNTVSVLVKIEVVEEDYVSFLFIKYQMGVVKGGGSCVWIQLIPVICLNPSGWVGLFHASIFLDLYQRRYTTQPNFAN